MAALGCLAMQTPGRVVLTAAQGRQQVLAELLGATSRRHPPWLESPFYCNYGFNLSGGRCVARAHAGPRSARRPQRRGGGTAGGALPGAGTPQRARLHCAASQPPRAPRLVRSRWRPSSS